MEHYTGLICGVGGFSVLGFLLSRVLKRNDVADWLWGLGFLGVSTVTISLEIERPSLLQNLSALFLLAWAVRLSVYLSLRLRGKPEDQRYAQWRKKWGKWEPVRAFFQVFLLQGLILGVVALPLVFIFQSRNFILGPYAFFGILLFLLGFSFEAVSDLQLYLFKKNPANRGKMMTEGLWAYCRHPNYFGEILIWWGFFFISFQMKRSWVAIASPLVLSFLLLRVSGVPMLENLLQKKGAQFQKYVRTTPAIFPVKPDDLLRFGSVILVTLGLDSIWLGLIAKDFYILQTRAFARVQNGSYAPLMWSAALVYLFIPTGALYFSSRESGDRWHAVFRGAVFGIVLYGTYEFTNLALVRDWPMEMAAVDLVWGTFLCAVGAGVAYRQAKPSS